jgi:hypothetical protein
VAIANKTPLPSGISPMTDETFIDINERLISIYLSTLYKR